ncbi:MAG: TldD/PmbA family protein [Dehalococcoidia bacterium]|nr:TldD/PmbA family protein [Dehalococcoidia bacterium]
MPDDTPFQLAIRAVEMAVAAGAEQCDAFAQGYNETSATVRLGEVEKLIEAGSKSLGLRVINQGRTAICSTSDFTDEAFETFVRDTMEMANISAPDEFAGLPEQHQFAKPRADGLRLFDESIPGMSVEQRLSMAKECEAAAMDADPRISNSDGSTVSTRFGEVALANSRGFQAGYPATSVDVVVEVMADDADGKKRNAYWYSAERSLHRLVSPAEVGRIAARRAVDQVGARKMDTRQVPVVFEPMMAAALARDLAGCATGSALYRGSTFLAGRAGEVIASPLLSLVDDPTVPGGLGSRPFDGEGLASIRNPIVAAGIFKRFLFDCYTARRTGNESTASAQRGIGSSPSPGASGLILEAGETDPGAIIGDVQEGLYLTTLMGFGFNPTTGDYSRGAAGFWIENGELAFPVTEVNISGRMDEMLRDIDAVGNDLQTFGSTSAPTVRISRMTVSGT